MNLFMNDISSLYTVTSDDPRVDISLKHLGHLNVIFCICFLGFKRLLKPRKCHQAI